MKSMKNNQSLSVHSCKISIDQFAAGKEKKLTFVFIFIWLVSVDSALPSLS